MDGIGFINLLDVNTMYLYVYVTKRYAKCSFCSMGPFRASGPIRMHDKNDIIQHWMVFIQVSWQSLIIKVSAQI